MTVIKDISTGCVHWNTSCCSLTTVGPVQETLQLLHTMSIYRTSRRQANLHFQVTCQALAQQQRCCIAETLCSAGTPTRTRCISEGMFSRVMTCNSHQLCLAVKMLHHLFFQALWVNPLHLQNPFVTVCDRVTSSFSCSASPSLLNLFIAKDLYFHWFMAACEQQ